MSEDWTFSGSIVKVVVLELIYLVVNNNKGESPFNEGNLTAVLLTKTTTSLDEDTEPWSGPVASFPVGDVVVGDATSLDGETTTPLSRGTFGIGMVP